MARRQKGEKKKKTGEKEEEEEKKKVLSSDEMRVRERWKGEEGGWEEALFGLKMPWGQCERDL